MYFCPAVSKLMGSILTMDMKQREFKKLMIQEYTTVEGTCRETKYACDDVWQLIREFTYAPNPNPKDPTRNLIAAIEESDYDTVLFYISTICNPTINYTLMNTLKHAKKPWMMTLLLRKQKPPALVYGRTLGHFAYIGLEEMCQAMVEHYGPYISDAFVFQALQRSYEGQKRKLAYTWREYERVNRILSHVLKDKYTHEQLKQIISWIACPQLQ